MLAGNNLLRPSPAISTVHQTAQTYYAHIQVVTDIGCVYVKCVYTETYSHILVKKIIAVKCSE